MGKWFWWMAVMLWWLPKGGMAQKGGLADSLLLQTGAGDAMVEHITREQLAVHYGKTLAQVLNTQAGLVISGANQPAGSMVSIYMEGAKDGKTLVLLDGMPLWDAASIPENFDLNFIPIYLIEQIDIYHGGQSTFLGAGAVAGVINIITRKALASKGFRCEAMLTTGNFKSGSAQLVGSGSTKKLHYQFGGSLARTDGFSDAADSNRINVLDTTPKKPFDKDGWHTGSGFAQLEYRLTPQLRLQVFGLYSRYRAWSDNNDFNDDDNYYYTHSHLALGFKTSFDNHRWHWLAQYKYGNNKRQYAYDPDAEETLGSKTHFANLQGWTSLTKRWRIGLGVDYRASAITHTQFEVTAGTEHLYYPSVAQHGLMGFAQYISLDSQVYQRFSFRRNVHSVAGITDVGAYQFGYRLGAFRITAMVAQAFVTPCMYQLYAFGLGNHQLQPERSVSYQLGVQYGKGRWQQQVRLFKRNISSVIDFDGNTSTYSNFSQLNVWGLGYSGSLPLHPLFTLQGNYSFLAGEETTISRVTYIDTVAYPYLIRRPKHVANLGLQFQNSRWQVLLSGKFVGSYKDVGYGIDDRPVPAYAVAELYAAYCPNTHAKVFLLAQNLTNNRYTDIIGFNTTPLTVTIGLNICFGQLP